MKKILLLTLILLFSSCKRDTSKRENLFYLLLGILNQQSQGKITFSANFPGVSSSAYRQTKAIPEGITDVLAISSANHYHRSKVDANGNFSLGLERGYPYLFVFIDTSNTVKGYYKIDNLSLNTIPTHYAGDSISGGAIEKSNSGLAYSPLRNFNLNEFINQTGNLSGGEIDSIVTLGDQMLNLLNLDTDGNGVIDLEEKLYLRLAFGQNWGDLNDNRFKISNARNQFFDISFLKTVNSGTTFGITIDKAKVTNKSVKIKFPIPSGCNRNGVTGNDEVSDMFDDSISGLVSASDGEKGFRSGSQIYNSLGPFSCNGTPGLFARGEYVVENSGKTYTFKNINPFYIDPGKTFILPTIKFNTNGNIIDSLEFKYKKFTPNGMVDATAREVALVYGNSPYYRTSGINCRDSNIGPWLFSCTFSKDIESGTITKCQSGSNVKVSSPKGVDITQVDNCNFYTYDAYGTYLGTGIYR